MTSNPNFVQIEKREAVELVIEKHYLHRKCPISYAWGIKIGEETKGVLTIGKPASWSTSCGLVGENKLQMKNPAARTHDVYELNRLWLDDSLPRNSESRFIAWCLKELRKKNPSAILVSYADGKQGHVGYVYQATNWIYTGSSTPFIDIAVEGFVDYRSVPQYLRGGFIYKCGEHGGFVSPYVEDGNIPLLRNCPKCGEPSKKTNKREWASKDVLTDSSGKEHRVFRVSRSIKHRYVWFADSQDKSILHWGIRSYPKKAA